MLRTSSRLGCHFAPSRNRPPFAGSGSVLVTALRLRCRCIGIDIDAQHHRTATMRLAAVTLGASRIMHQN
jgi:DNA modification methylase